ncbi:MAG: D-2-hydroxyacid dehydrogenase [Eubacteriales bacterium]|nr:D-2-hydroxyacid dehydrogenase [bacterium]MDY2791422.1 D-2-hydroxyacid dehydrogenase [Eubacteriales bacterium]
MKIVALDALQLMDLDWSGLRAIDPGLVTYDATAPERVVERAKDAEILLVNKVKLTREVLEQLPALRYVGVLATGYDNVDCAAAREKGVVVTNVPGYSTDSVAQLVFALLLELCHQTGHHSDTVKAGRWANQPYYCYWDSPLIELAGKTMGIFGLGKIGRRTAQIAQAFGMKVIACSRTKKDVPGVTWVGFDELLRESDVLSLSSPLTDQTRGLINKDALSKMKKTAFLINTSRGGLLVEQDVREALDAGVIAGAAVDVLSTEPPKADNPLIGAKNIVITPHIAWATTEARTRLLEIVRGNIAAWQAGNTQNRVN